MAGSWLMAQSSKLTTKVSYNADDATLSSVLNALSRQSGCNVVLAADPGAGDKEERRVTLNIKDVPIETAVSLVARVAGLAYRVEGENTFVVGTKQNISEESGERSKIIYLKNLDAAKVAKSLENTSGKVVPLEGQNAVMVYANPETFKNIEDLITGIDVDQNQIEIRVRLIEVHLNHARKMGIDWSRLNHLTTILAEDPVNARGTGLPFNYSDVEDTCRMETLQTSSSFPESNTSNASMDSKTSATSAVNHCV